MNGTALYDNRVPVSQIVLRGQVPRLARKLVLFVLTMFMTSELIS